MARLLGVRANRVIAVAFVISGVLASMVSLYLVAQTGSVSYKMGVNMVLIAFVASVIGGMGSLTGAALGGFLVGIVSVSLQAYLPVDLRPYRDAFVFLAFIAFLLWRPQGLMTRARRHGAGVIMAPCTNPPLAVGRAVCWRSWSRWRCWRRWRRRPCSAR